MNDRKALISLLENKFRRLASQRKAALDVPGNLGESILETIEEDSEDSDLAINHGDDAQLPAGFLDFLNEPPAVSPEGKNKS